MVYFIGAGPGDPELITVKGAKIIKEADIIIYAGSLVNKELLNTAKADCQIYDSAGMNLDEVIEVTKTGVAAGKMVARVHTGDPAIFGAIREQMDRLIELNIDYDVIPGVSSFFGAAAALKKEFTLPGITQTVILTRMEGRTGVPKEEEISSLAMHKATMVIFLSVHMMEDLCEKLRKGYDPETPVAVVYKATWPEQRIVRGTLITIADEVKKEKISKTALVMVGRFLGDDYELSKLYDKGFTHEFRNGV